MTETEELERTCKIKVIGYSKETLEYMWAILEDINAMLKTLGSSIKFTEEQEHRVLYLKAVRNLEQETA